MQIEKWDRKLAMVDDAKTFLGKLVAKINDSDVYIKHLGDIEVKDYNNDIQKR